MQKLPQQLTYAQMLTKWAAAINPFITNPVNDSSVLANVALVSGSNTINHLLGRKLQGWRIRRKRAAAEIYDTQDSNQTPELTLLLNASAPVTIDLEVY